MPVSASGVMLVPWIVPKGVLIGVPPAYALPSSAVWQPRQLPRCASSAPFATCSRGNDCGRALGAIALREAQPENPVTMASAVSSATPPITLRLLASWRFVRASNGYAVLVDHFATKPSGNNQEHERDERKPDQATGVRRFAPAHHEVDDVERDDREIKRHVLDRRGARTLGQRQQIDESRQRREQRADDAARHGVQGDRGPRLGARAAGVEQIADEREDPQADRDRHEHRVDRMAGNAGGCLHTASYGWDVSREDLMAPLPKFHVRFGSRGDALMQRALGSMSVFTMLMT